MAQKYVCPVCGRVFGENQLDELQKCVTADIAAKKRVVEKEAEEAKTKKKKEYETQLTSLRREIDYLFSDLSSAISKYNVIAESARIFGMNPSPITITIKREEAGYSSKRSTTTTVTSKPFPFNDEIKRFHENAMKANTHQGVVDAASDLRDLIRTNFGF